LISLKTVSWNNPIQTELFWDFLKWGKYLHTTNIPETVKLLIQWLIIPGIMLHDGIGDVVYLTLLCIVMQQNNGHVKDLE
jgi:hypothetical protein